MSFFKDLSYVAGVLLVVGFIITIPKIFALSQSWFIGFGFLLLAVALVRAISDTLMGEIEKSPARFIKQFLAVFIATSFQVGLVVAILPVVALQLIWVFAALGAVVTLIGIGIGIFQLYLGIDLGAAIKKPDIAFTLVIFNSCLAVLGLGLLVSAYLENNEDYDGFFAYIGLKYQRLMTYLTN